MNFTLQIKGLEEFVNDSKRAGLNVKPMMTQAMQRATLKVKNAIQENITAKGITFQGSLRRSVQVNQATWDKGVVGVGEKYGSVVEAGRRPGGKMPPVKAIERWAEIKLNAKGAGFVIAKKIQRQGTKAQPFVEPAFRSEAQYVVDQFGIAANMIMSQMAGK